MEPPDLTRYTEGACRAIAGSQAEARRQGRRCVMPIDMLVGLLRDDEKSSAARRALDILGIKASVVCRTLDRVEAGAANQAVGRHRAAVTPLPEDTPCIFGIDSTRVLEGAARLTARDGETHTGTEHLLLALYDDPAAPLVRSILQDFGVKDGGNRTGRDMLVEALKRAVASRSAET